MNIQTYTFTCILLISPKLKGEINLLYTCMSKLLAPTCRSLCDLLFCLHIQNPDFPLFVFLAITHMLLSGFLKGNSIWLCHSAFQTLRLPLQQMILMRYKFFSPVSAPFSHVTDLVLNLQRQKGYSLNLYKNGITALSYQHLESRENSLHLSVSKTHGS